MKPVLRHAHPPVPVRRRKHEATALDAAPDEPEHGRRFFPSVGTTLLVGRHYSDDDVVVFVKVLFVKGMSGAL